jgi:hypothetical protein
MKSPIFVANFLLVWEMYLWMAATKHYITWNERAVCSTQWQVIWLRWELSRKHWHWINEKSEASLFSFELAQPPTTPAYKIRLAKIIIIMTWQNTTNGGPADGDNHYSKALGVAFILFCNIIYIFMQTLNCKWLHLIFSFVIS